MIDMKRFMVPGTLVLLLLCGCDQGVRTSSGPQTIEERKNQAKSEEKEAIRVKEERSGEWSPGLSEDEKETLFAIAQNTLEWCVKGGRGKFFFDKYSITPKLKERTATFVTLKIGDMLRGCIGSLTPVAEMYRSVHDNTVNAALRDFRFRPVTPMELEKIDMHISLLSPIVDIASLDEFKIGEHGIILEKGQYRAVYLPEVAVEQKWTKEETLSSLSQKAGMNRDAWREGTSFKVFSSVVLSE